MKVRYPLLCILIFLFYHKCLFAQTPLSIAWQKTPGGPGNDIIEDIYPTADGNYILFGLVTDNGGDVSSSCQVKGVHDVWIVKMDPMGNIIWQQCYGGSKEEGNPFSKIIQTSDGGYLFVTEVWSDDFDVVGHHAYSDAWTMKLDANGNMQWAKSFGGYVYDVPRNLYELPNHKYLVMSRTTSSDGDVPASMDSLLFDAWVFIVDDDGNILTNKVYGGTGDDDLYKALPAADGNIALFGLTTSTDGDLTGETVDSTDAWVLTIDTLGNIISSKTYGGPHIEYFFDALNTDDGGYIAFGEAGDPGTPIENGYWHGDQDYWAMKLDAIGNVQWQGLYGGSVREQFRRACKLPGGSGYFMAGSTNSIDGDVTNEGGSGRDWWIVQIGPNGELTSSVALGGSGSDFGYAIVEPGIAVGGTFSDDGDVIGLQGTSDGWVIQLDYATAVNEALDNQNSISIYPNPSSDKVTIESTNAAPASYTIRNMYGQILHSTTSPEKKVELNISNYLTGIYMLEVASLSGTSQPLITRFEVMK
ncbi:MAG: T9SS type A sorting domain-containing protein [Chitinophagales bacterium]